MPAVPGENHLMTRNHHRTSHPTRRLLSCALASCLLLGAAPAFAQSTSATIRGQVMADSAPAGQAQVTATNLATGLSRSVQSTASGGYSLAGLPPGTYRLDVDAGGKRSSQNITVQVGQTATVNLGVGGVGETAQGGAATTLDTVQVVASPVETRTSEVATYITRKQIEALPQGTRNFLAFADTVPGMQFTQDAAGNTKLRSGAQGTSGINVYIDGVGQKGYTLPGGVGGQDSTRGNPFPQSAIGEYKVITSNYKAEFDQISSAAVVAATRSGSNEFEGSFFWDRTSTDWRTATPAEEKAGGKKVPSKEEQYGVSFGGPIVQDRLNFFVAYEAKEYSTPKTVSLGAQGRYDLSDIPADILAQIGPAASPFTQDMYFGKLTWTPDDRNLIELSAQVRKEDERIGVGDQNTAQRATINHNEVNRYDLRWQYSADNWLNDAHVTYEDLSWAPQPTFDGNGYILGVSEPTSNDRINFGTIINTGASPNNQDKGQKGWSIQNDFTFTGWESHTVKMGVKYKAVDVNAVERNYSNPQFYYDLATGIDQPYRVEFATGDPGTSGGFTTSANKQFGIYIQDDWEVNEHLTVNYGVRWDYETTPNYEDFVTPAGLADDIRNYPNFQNTDWNPDDYISTGKNRDAFKGAWQPRLGFSYDLNADQRHVIFGGAGRAYDRNLFDYLQIETNRTSFGRYNFYFTDADDVCRRPAGDCVAWDPSYLNPGALDQLAATVDLPREWWLNNNDLKVPYSDQFSLGMRNAFELGSQTWYSEVTLSYVRSHDGITARLGNRRPDGSFLPPGHTWGTPWGFDPPFGRVILLDNMYETKTKSVLVKLDKPFNAASRWGATMAYTYTRGRQNNNSDGWIDMFEYPNTSYYGWLPARGVPEHRLVTTGIWDAGWGVTLSGKLTLESTKYRNATNCLPGWDDCLIDPYKPNGSIGYKRFDLAASKEWDTGTALKLRVRADLLNVFDWTNWDGYDDWYGGPNDPNVNFGRHQDGILGGTRTFKLSFGLDW
jgi:outer membrane receptor protein involved in Fe transport